MDLSDRNAYRIQLRNAYEKLKASSLPAHRCGSPASEHIVFEIERILGLKIPDAVCEFMKLYGLLDIGCVVPGYVKEDMFEHYASIIRTQRDAAEYGFARENYLVVYRDDIEDGAVLCDGTPNPPVVRVLPSHTSSSELPIIFATYSDMVCEMIDQAIAIKKELDEEGM